MHLTDEAGEGVTKKMRMKKSIFVLALSLMLAVLIMPSMVGAYAGGKVQGKPFGQYKSDAVTSLGLSSNATDGDLGTYIRMEPTNIAVLYMDLTATPINIDSYQLKATASTNQLFLRFDFKDGTYDYFKPVASGVKTAKAYTKPIVTIQLWTEHAGGYDDLFEFDVFGSSVTVPIAPTNVKATTEPDTIKLTWDALAGEIKGYNVYVDGVKKNTALVTGTSYEMAPMTNGKAYSLQVSGVDTVDREGPKSVAISATPPFPPDTTPPGAPTALTGTGGDSIANLSWAAPSDTDVDGYHVFRDGVRFTASLVKGTNYQVTGLVNDQAYEFTVKAYDTSGNESVGSNTITVTPSDVMAVTMIPNGTSIVVRIKGGKLPVKVSVNGGEEQTFTQREFAVTGLAKSTDYTVAVTDANLNTYSEVINTGTTVSYIPPVMPDSTSLFQRMVNAFGRAGTIALYVIGGAVALGVLIILGLWAWRLTKRWLATSK
jgi:hypothetical protein